MPAQQHAALLGSCLLFGFRLAPWLGHDCAVLLSLLIVVPSGHSPSRLF